MVGTFSRFTMEPLIGDFIQPLPHLAIHVSQVGEGAQRPEVLAQVSDAGALNLALTEGIQLRPVLTVRRDVSG